MQILDSSFRTAVVVLLALVAAGTVSCNSPPPDEPNLLFVFPDQFRRQAMGVMEQDPVRTPHIDRFASEGLLFTDAVSNRPVCSPMRAMLMTGQYPFSNGVLTNTNSWSAQYGIELDEDARTFSDVLDDAGYATGYIGKWHLDSPREPYVERPREWDGNVWDHFTPPERRHGFDFWHAYGVYDDHFNPHYWTTDAAKDEQMEVDAWSPEHEADIACAFLRNEDGAYRESGAPFALFVSMNPPHPPYDQVPERYREVYEGMSAEELLVRPNVDLDSQASARARRHVADYFAAATGVDEQFGRILDCLSDAGNAEETVVVFTADHGEMMGSQGRMQKTTWHEESIGIPFIVRWPGRVEEGRTDLLLSVPDMMPTLLGLLGLSEHIPPQVEGADYSPLLQGREVERPEAALYLNTRPEPSRQLEGARGLRTHRYTFVIRRDGDGSRDYVLHDNVSDPYQLGNVADEHPELVADFERQLTRRLAEIGDPWVEAR